MNSQDLLDYHLGLLEPPALGGIERDLAADEALDARSRRLGEALRLLLDDGDPPEPPANLAGRTIAAVEDRRSRPRVLEFAPPRVPFRWADFAVAAGIFLAGLATLLPAIGRTRDQRNQAACTYNLQQIGLGFAGYANGSGAYPQPPVGYPAGYYSVQLSQAGELHDPSVLRCPCHRSESPARTIPDSDQFQSLMGTDPASCSKLVCDQYAYNAGFRAPSTGVQPVPADVARLAPMPLLADLPPRNGSSRVLEGNSPDHGYAGQNVLFSDQSVRFLRSRELPGDDDIYLNVFGRPALGGHPGDTSLIPAGFPIRTR